MDTPNIFARLVKVDEARRLVIGRAIQEIPDRADEVFDYDSSKPYFQEWSKSVSDATDGKSLGNVRAMHGAVAAGKLTGIEFNDAEKAIDVEAKVVDDAEWKKVLEGVYTGFSIGGKYVGEKKIEKVDGRDVKRYTAKPSELSLVDLPCVPTASFFEIRKADGATEQRQYALAKVEPAITPKPKEEPIDTVTATLAEIAKVGAKHSKETLDTIGQMHDNLAKMADGAHCKAYADDSDMADKAARADLQKRYDEDRALINDLAKAVGIADGAPMTAVLDEILKLAQERSHLTEALAKAIEHITELNKQPAYGKGVLRVVGKADDYSQQAASDPEVKPVMKANGEIDEGATMIKKILSVPPINQF